MICISANFLFIVLKSGNFGICLTTYGRVKACLYRAQTRKAVQTMRKTARFAVLIESGFPHENHNLFVLYQNSIIC